MSCSVFIDPEPLPGAQNMAIDEAMLQAAIEDQFCGLRFYRWDEPTLSLGHFQKPEKLILEERFVGLPMVRRLSGGGAILHDQELTYSCVVPSNHPITQNPSQLYDIVHNVFVTILADFGVECSFRTKAQTELDSAFLCFLRGDPRDLIIDGHKILGSAQRRRKGAILQHGSLILKTSEKASEIQGIEDLSINSTLDFDQLSMQISEALAPGIGSGITTEYPLNKWESIRSNSDSLQANYVIPRTLSKPE